MLRHSHKHIQKLWKKFSLSLSKFGVGALPFVAIITLIAGFFVWYTNNRVVDKAEAATPATTVEFLNNTMEASESQAEQVIPVLLNGVAPDEVTIDYEIIGGTATVDQDYLLPSTGTLTVPKGERGIGIQLELINEKLEEGNETIQIELSNPTGGVNIGGNAILEFTITDSKNLSQDPYFGLAQEIDTLPVIDNPAPTSLPDFATTSPTSLPDFSALDPASLTVTDGLSLRLEADSLSESDGAPLSSWADISGEGNDFSHTVASEQPTVIHSAYNNKKAVRFDGVDDHLNLLDTGILTGKDEFDVIIVEAPGDITTNNTQTIFNLSQASQDFNSAPGLLVERRGVNRLFGYTQPEFSTSNSSSVNFNTTNELNEPNINNLSKTSISLDLYQNGLFVDSKDESGLFQENQKIRLGRYKETSFQSYNGDVLEILVYNRLLSNIERNEINCYLSQKYNIEISGCGNPLQLHLDADTLTENDGSLLQSWGDETGNNSAIQNDPASQPIVVHNARNGKKVVRFDGNSDHLELSEFYNNPNSTIFTVGNHTGSDDDAWFSDYGRNGSEFLQFRNSNGSLYARYADDGNSAILVNEPAPFQDYFINGSRLQETELRVNHNGIEYEASSTGYDFDTNFSGSTQVPTLGALQTPTTVQQHWDGDIAEFIYFNRALTDDEFSQVECYLSEKYAIDVDGCGTSLKIHLDANQLTGSDGSNVSIWNDLTSSGIDATQLIGANQPTLVHDAINNKQAVRFDGTDDYLELPEFYTDSNSTLIAVAKKTGAQTGDITMFSDYGDASNEWVKLQVDNNAKLKGRVRDDDNTHLIPTTNGLVTDYIIGGLRMDDQTLTLFNNNEQISQNNTFNKYINFDGPVDIPLLGAEGNLNGVTRSGFFDGDIAEFIYYDRPLSDEEFKEVRCYLAGKYGINEINTCGNALMLNLDAETLSGANNSQVVSWTDGSGNSLDATQSDGAKQPLLIENAINGNKAVRFDGVDDYLELPEFIDTQDLTMYFVGTKNDDTGSILYDEGDASDKYIHVQFSSDDLIGTVKENVTKQANSGILFDNGENYIARLYSDQKTLDVSLNKFKNINTQSSFDVSARYDNQNFAPPIIGARADFSSERFLSGDIAQILIFDGSLSEKQQTEVECYLSRRYAIENNSCFQDTIDFYVDATQVSPQDVSGNNLNIWRDVSGEGKNFEPINTNSTPSYNDDLLHPSVTFDGGDTLENIADDIMFDSGNYTAFATLRPTTNAGNIHDFSNSTIGRYRTSFSTNNITYGGTSSSFSTIAIGAPANTTWSTAHLIKNNTNSGAPFYINDQYYAGTNLSGLGGQKNNALIGAGLNGEYFNSLLFNKTLQVSEVEIIQNILIARSGSTEMNDYKYTRQYPRITGASSYLQRNEVEEVLNVEIDTDSEATLFAGFSPVEQVALSTADITGSTATRWNNIFALDKTGDTGANLTFDFEKYLGGIPSGNDYQLLYRPFSAGDFNPVSVQNTNIDGTNIRFEVDNSDLQDGYYTMGTTNASSSPLSPASLPEQINNLTANLNSQYGEVNLSFSAPNNNGSTITDYIIEYSTNDFNTVLIYNDGVSTNTSYTLTDLLNGPNYSFRVKAVTTADTISNPSNIAEVAFEPRINSITPNTGVPEGGQEVTINGDNLDLENGPLINIDNSGNPSLDDYIANFAVDTRDLYTRGVLDENCGNLNITHNGITIPFWINENTCNTENTQIYTKIDLEANEQKELRLITLGLGQNRQDPENTFEFFDDFEGASLDTAKYYINNPNNYLTQDDALIIQKNATGWQNPALFSNQTFERRNIEFITEYTNTCGDSNQRIMIGWQDGSSLGYQQMHHAQYYYTNNSTRYYTNGSNQFTGPSQVCDQKYYLKTSLKETGGATFYRSIDGVTWELVFDTTTNTDTNLNIGFDGYAGNQITLDNFIVKSYSDINPVIQVDTSPESLVDFTLNIDGKPASFKEVVNGEIIFEIPTAEDINGGLSTVDVEFINSDLQSDTLPGGFTYVGPTINSITPSQGSIIGGYQATISGSNIPLNDRFIGEQVVTIANNTGSSITDAEVFLTFNSKDLIERGFLDGACDNLRTRLPSGADINHWLEFGCNTELTGLWVQVPTLPTGSVDIELYFASSGASSLSDSSNFSFDPLINGSTNKLWLKADEFAGQSEGIPISTWTDNSSSGLDATQINAGEQPTLETDSLNGLPAIKFDGIDDSLANFTAGPIPAGDDSYSIILVWSPQVSQSAGIFDQTSSTSQNGQRAYVYQANTQYGFGIEGSQGTRSAPNPGEYGLTQITTNENASSNTQNILNDNVTTANFDNATKNISNDLYGLGYNTLNNNAYYNGSIAEVMVFDEDITASLGEIRAYLNQKYQLFGSLPVVESITEKSISLEIDVDGQQVTGINIVDEQTVLFTVPPQVSTGTSTVTLTTPYGNTATIPFDYVDPQINSLLQTDGAVEGGYEVTLNGTGFVQNKFYKKITLDNSANIDTLSNYQVMLTLDTSLLIKDQLLSENCQELSIVDTDQFTQLPFWIVEETCGTTETNVWVNIATLNANSTKDIYYEIDPSRTTSIANGDNVFTFFDNFEDGIFDTQKWSHAELTSQHNISEINGGIFLEGGFGGINSPREIKLESVNAIAGIDSVIETNATYVAVSDKDVIPYFGSEGQGQTVYFWESNVNGLNNRLNIYSIDGAGTSNALTTIAGLQGTKHMKITRTNSEVLFEVDEQSASLSTNIPTNTQNVYTSILSREGFSSTVFHEWYFVRNYFENEPVITQEASFANSHTINFGANEVEEYQFISPAEFKVIVPASTLTSGSGNGDGVVDVVYTDSNGSTSTLSNSFEYKLPVINSITPTAGPDQGGNDVVINGEYFSELGYSIPITITNTTSPLTDYEEMVVVDTKTLIEQGKLGADCAQLRIKDSTGNNLHYYIDGGCNTAYTAIWFKIPTLPTGDTVINITYTGSNAIANGDDISNFSFGTVINDPDNYYWVRANEGVDLDQSGNVLSWQNSTGLLDFATNAGGTTIPTLDEDFQDQELPSIYFDGNDYLNADLSGIAGTDVTYIVSGSRESAGVIYAIGNESGSANSALYLGHNNLNQAHFVRTSNGTATGIIPNYTARQNNVLTGILNASTGLELYNNGTSIASGISTAVLTANPNGRIGAHITNEWVGGINEVIVYTKALSTTERESVENYLLKKYDINSEITLGNEVLSAVTIDNEPLTNAEFIDSQTITGEAPAGNGNDKDVVYSSISSNQATLSQSYDYGVDLPPNAINDLSAEVPASGIINLTWSEPNNNGQPITDYIIEYATQSDFSDSQTYIDGTNTDTTITISDLDPFTTYYFRISPVNSVGTGPVSNEVEVASQVCDFDASGQDVIISNNTTLAGVYCNVDEFRIESGVTAAIPTFEKFEVYANDITILGDVDGKGQGYPTNTGFFAEGNGPGKGTSNGGNYASGASHGAFGGIGRHTSILNLPQQPYGTIEYPNNYGSSGANGGSTNDGAGSGGGVVKFVAQNSVVLDGSISVNAGDVLLGGSGGAGGSIWIDTGSISGAGSLYANGSRGETGGAGGSGGRIALYANNNNFNGVMEAKGGLGVTQSQSGGAGTIYQNIQGVTSLDIDNLDTVENTYNNPLSNGAGETPINNEFYLGDSIDDLIMSGYVEVLLESDIELGNSTLTVSENSLLIVDSQINSPQPFDLNIAGSVEFIGVRSHQFNDVYIYSTGSITHPDNGTSENHKLDLNVANFTMEAGSNINLNGLGYDGATGNGNGPGFGPGGGQVNFSSCSSSGGAGYGGVGGNGGTQVSGSGAIYGSKDQPINIGSGGARACYISGSQFGSDGGGAIKIIASEDIIIDGNISVNGSPASTGSNGAGSGSGGSIWLGAKNILGSGQLSANGGNTNGSFGGGGGGGRISLNYEDKNGSLTVASAGGSGSTENGQDGTIYEHQIPESNLTSATFDSIPDPVSINAQFDVRIQDILNIHGNPIRDGVYDDVECSVTITGDGGNYSETISGGNVVDGVCILPASFTAPTVTGPYTADITVIGSDIAQTTETKTGITFNVVAQASNKAAAQNTPNETKPIFTTLIPPAVQLIGQPSTILSQGYQDSGNGEALNGIPCEFNITDTGVYDANFTTSNLVGGECSYEFDGTELPPVAGQYFVTSTVEGDSGFLETDLVTFDREFDIELTPGDNLVAAVTPGSNPLIGDEENTLTSDPVYKYDGVTLIDEGTICEFQVTDNATTHVFTSTINSSGICEFTIPPSTLTGASVDIVLQVTLDINSSSYNFLSSVQTFNLVGSPSNLAKEDAGNPGQPVYGAQDSNIDPAFLNEDVTLTVDGLLDSITDQPLEGAVCNFAVTNPNINSFVFNTTTASSGECTITVPGPDLLDGGNEVEGTYSFILNIVGDSGTLTTPSTTFDRLYNIDLVGGFIPGSATTTPSPVVVGQTYNVRSARIYRYNGSTVIQNGFPCENEVVVNSGAPQIVSGTTSSGYCNTTMPASGSTGNGTIVSRVTVAGQEFETGATPFEVKALNNAQICTLVFRDDTSDQSYDGAEELFAGNQVRLSGTNYTTTTLTTTNTGYVCFGSLFDGTYTLEILNGGPGGTQTLPVGGGDYSIILTPGDTQNRAFGFNGNAPVCPYPIFTDTNEDGVQNNGETSLVDVVNTLPLALYEVSDLVNPIDTLNANGSLCFSDQSPGDYVIEMDIPAGMSSTGSGFTENGGKVTRPVTVGFGVQGDVAFSFSFDPTGDPVEDPANPGQPINNGTIVNSSNTVYVGYNFDATTGGLLDTGNDAALEGLNGATCSMEFTGPSFPGGLIKSGVVTAGECYVDPVPDTAGPHGVTTTVDGPSGNPLTTIITTFDVVPNNIDICPLPFRDYNQNQTRDINEPYIQGLTATLVDNNTSNTVATLVTDDQGLNCFEDVEAADVDDYQVNITQPPSSTETTATGLSVNVDPLPDTDENVFFGFKGVIDICVANVYMDNNENQTQDGTEPGLANHQYSLRDEYNYLIQTVTTDAAGRGCVAELLDGTYEMTVTDPNLNPLDTSLTGTQALTRNVVAVAGGGNGANINEYVESYGFENDAVICPNPTFADYDKDGVFDSGEDEIGGLSTRLYLGSDNTGTLLQTINTNGTLCFDAVATADTGGNFNFFIEQDVPTGGVLTSTSETYSFTQDFGKDVDKRFGYKGNATICPYPTFQDNNLNGAFDSEPTIDGVITTLKDTTNTEIGTIVTNHTANPCFTELLESTYILSQERPANTVSTTGGTIQNVVTTAGNQEDVAFGYDGRPLICPVVYRDDDANGLFDPNEFRFSQVDVTLRNSGGTLLETITSTSGERCFDTANTSIGNTFIVESLAFPNYVITTSIGNGSPNDNPDNTAALTFGQKYEPEFGYNGNGSICAQNIFEDFNANGIYDGGTDTFLTDGVQIELTTLQGSTDYGTVAISGGNACFNNVAPGQYSLDVLEADKPLGSISTTGGVQTIVLSPGQTQNFNFGFTGDVTICPQVTFEDIDYNGIYNPSTETQLSGITVNLYRGANLTTPYDTLTLNGSGIECFNGLFADDYRVEQVDVDTVFTGQYWNTTEAIQSGTDPDDYYVDLTTVSQDYITQDFGYTQNPDFTLGAIFGFLYVDRAEDGSYDIAGTDNFELTVFDNDVPVVDQTVLLYKFNTTSSQFEEIDSTVSDAAGNYRFDKLGIGDYEVRIPNNSLVGIKSVNPDPSIRAYTITNNATTGLNDKFYDAELSFQFTARICPFMYIDLNEDGNYDVGSDYSITDNEGAVYSLSYVSFNGSQSAGTFNTAGGSCAEELPPRDYTVTLSNPFGSASDGAFGPSSEYPVNFYDQVDETSWSRTVYLASEITDIETRLFSQVNIDRTPSQIEGRVWHNRPIYGSGNPFDTTYDVDGGDDKTENADDPGNTSGYDYDYDNDYGYGGVTLELIKCYDGFQDPVPVNVWNANPPTTVTDSDGFYRFDDTNVNFTDGMGGFYNLIPGDYAVIRQGALPNESSLTGVRAKQCEHFGIPPYEKQSIFFDNYPAGAPQAPNNRTPITPGTVVTQDEMLFYDGVIENNPYIDQSQNLLKDGTERSCYVQNCPAVPTPATHVYGEFELRDQASGDILAVVPYNINSGAVSNIGYSGTNYGGIPGIIPGNYEVEMINIEPLDGTSQPHYSEIQPGELLKTHTQLNQEENLYDYGFNPLFGTFIEGYVYINRNGGVGVDIDGADDNPVTDFDNDEPLNGYTVQIFDSAGNLVGTETTDINGFWNYTPGGQGLPEGTYSIQVIDAPPTGTNCGNCNTATFISVLGGSPSATNRNMTYVYEGYIGSDAFVDNNNDGDIEDTDEASTFWPDGREIAIRNAEIDNSRVWDYQVYLYYEKGTAQEYLVVDDFVTPTCGIPSVSVCVDLDNLTTSFFMRGDLKPGTYTLDLVINDPSLTLTSNSTGVLTNVITLGPKGKNWVRWAFNPRTNNSVSGNVFVDRGTLNEVYDPAGEDGLVGTGNDADSFDNELALQNATVKIHGPNGTIIEADAVTDSSGNYTITGLETGLYKLYDTDPNNNQGAVPFIETTDTIINTLQAKCITFYGCYGVNGTGFATALSRGTVLEVGTNVTNNMTYIYTNSLAAYSVEDLNGDGVISSYSNGDFDTIVGNQDYEIEHINTGKVLTCDGNNYTDLDPLSSNSYGGDSVCFWQALPAEWNGTPSEFEVRKLANLPDLDLVVTRRISGIFGPSSNGLSLGPVDSASYTFNQFGLNQQQAFAFYQAQGVVTNNASITGFAFIDINGDGIYQPNGLDGDPQTPEDNETPLVDTSYILSGDIDRTVDAGPLGQYQFTDLPQGNYTVTSDIDPGTVSYSMRIIGAVLINDAVNGDYYRVTFSTQGFEPTLSGRHLRFYWDTEDTSATGQEVFDTGPYEVPITNRPPGANQICAVIMEDATTLIPNSGDCEPLP